MEVSAGYNNSFNSQVLYNAAEPPVDLYGSAKSVISSDGTVLWIPSIKYQSTCSVDPDSDDYVNIP